MIKHVLLDADGVMQRVPGGWVAALEPHLGLRAQEFLVAVAEDEQPCLRGGGDFLEAMGGRLADFGLSGTARELHRAVWCSVQVEPTSVALVHALRDAGCAVHLGTNQEAHRAAYMRDELGYADLFDACFFSCELGAAKPEPDFFCRVLDRLGCSAPEVLFVDDHEPNVVAALECGLAAEHWRLDDGPELLRRRLSTYGLTLA
ncbi:HAD family hydrolase [Nocardioides panaciterrulae]|uniref:Putative hydrolase of the HAD superfamily n=1 Tax=Nocardioides panaciterrulae TaxID=661492 RepID=A0A7Y9JC67_9ACTN|nr:HAD-IA family hydrolase [Nocardioides panaciterrulae]NYD43088.1 putative hydrolase of the HAD superfamily [Nocardioides panaciterrulae]